MLKCKKKKKNNAQDKTRSVEKYLNKISSYQKDIINNLKKADVWKTQLTIRNNVISSIDNDEEHVMHLKCDNTDIMNNNEHEVIKDVSDSFKSRYQNNTGSRKVIDYAFDYVHLIAL